MSHRFVGSLFSGAGGFDLGFEAAGFELAWQVEINRDCMSVLERHWPGVPRWGDVSAVDPADLAPVDVVIGGFPCQDLSVAGKRAGLKGERSGLYWEVVRIVREMREATDGRYPAFVVLENVPGLLSSHRGRDFAAVLGGLRELGAAVGYRILDARFFGVPQRRRRVFIVAGFAGGCARAQRTAEVLSLFSRGGRDSASSGAAREGAPGDAEDGAGEPCVYQCHGNNVGAIGTLRQGNGGLTGGVPFVANSVTSSAGHHGHSSPRGDGSDNLVVQGPSVAPPLTAGGHPNSNAPGRRHEDDENLVVQRAVAYPISSDAASGRSGEALTPSADAEGNVRLRPPSSGVGDPSFTVNACAAPAVAISENQRAELRETPYARQIASGGGKPGQGYGAVRRGMAVRRLTPRECERLQGWPSDHTRWRANGDEIGDGPRYRMVGNGVAAPVAAWVGRHLLAALEG